MMINHAYELYPEVSVVAIEPAEVPYALAKKNIENSAYAQRIDLRKVVAQNIQEENIFDVIWFPQGFLTNPQDYQIALDKVYRALKPSGALMVVTAVMEPGVATINKFVNSLSSADRSAEFLKNSFMQVGFKNIEILPVSYSVIPIIALK